MNTARNNEQDEWVQVANAARILGVSKQAIRQRIYRDTIPHRKEADGTVYVCVTGHIVENTSESHYGNTDKSNTESYAENNAETNGTTDLVSRELIDELRDRLAFTERQLEQANERDRENRRIIAGLVQRVPELEAAPEPRHASETASPRSDRGTAPKDAQEPVERRSWLYRFFFGP